jgi:hypothetical protein
VDAVSDLLATGYALRITDYGFADEAEGEGGEGGVWCGVKIALDIRGFPGIIGGADGGDPSVGPLFDKMVARGRESVGARTHNGALPGPDCDKRRCTALLRRVTTRFVI